MATAEWFRSFFSGTWLEVQRGFWAAEVNEKHTDLVERVLALRPGSRVLDVPCGTGRLTVALARRGHAMTGVDLTPAFLADARASAGDLPIALLERDMRDLQDLSGFDAAFNYWGSFGYFDDAGDETFGRAVCAALAPGGRFLIETHVSETLLPQFQPRGWMRVGDVTILEERTLDLATSRIEVDWTFLRGADQQTRHLSMRLYTCHELAELLRRAGFASVRFLDAATEAPLAMGARRALVVATKAPPTGS